MPTFMCTLKIDKATFFGSYLVSSVINA